MAFHVVRVDPYHPSLGVLAPLVAARMVEYAKAHTPEVDPGQFTANLMSKVWGRDLDIIVLAVVNEKGHLFGHVVATLQDYGAEKWVMVIQTKQDADVGDAIVRAMQDLEAWGRENGAQRLLLSSHRADSKWQKKYGFKTHRYLMTKSL